MKASAKQQAQASELCTPFTSSPSPPRSPNPIPLPINLPSNGFFHLSFTPESAQWRRPMLATSPFCGKQGKSAFTMPPATALEVTGCASVVASKHVSRNSTPLPILPIFIA